MRRHLVPAVIGFTFGAVVIIINERYWRRYP